MPRLLQWFTTVVLAATVPCIAYAEPAPRVLRYEDDHVRLVEMNYPPGAQDALTEGIPYSSVVAYGAARASSLEVSDLASGKVLDDTGWGWGPAPAGRELPICQTVNPLPPLRVYNAGGVAAHYYRIEFKRVDGDAFRTEWANWYPYLREPYTAAQWFKKSGHRPYGQAAVTQPPQGSPTERTLNPEGYPYPDAYDSVRIAARQHWLRYEDGQVRFIEVMYRRGERGDAMHGHPYPSVFAMDSVRGHSNEELLDPGSDLNGQGTGKGPGPAGAQYPICRTMAPQAPHRPSNADTFPMHFYRLEFKKLGQAH